MTRWTRWARAVSTWQVATVAIQVMWFLSHGLYTVANIEVKRRRKVLSWLQWSFFLQESPQEFFFLLVGWSQVWLQLYPRNTWCAWSCDAYHLPHLQITLLPWNARKPQPASCRFVPFSGMLFLRWSKQTARMDESTNPRYTTKLFGNLSLTYHDAEKRDAENHALPMNRMKVHESCPPPCWLLRGLGLWRFSKVQIPKIRMP